MIRILSYSTQLSDHLKIRDALKGISTILPSLDTEIKIDSVFSVDIINDFIKKSINEGQPIYLIIYNEKITDTIINLLPDQLPIICTSGFEKTDKTEHPPREMVFFQSPDEVNDFTYLVGKCLQMQILKHELTQSQSPTYDNHLSYAHFIEILGDYLNRAFVHKSSLGLILFKFVSYGREQSHPKNIADLQSRYHAYLSSLLEPGWRLYTFGTNNLGVIVEDLDSLKTFDVILRNLHQETNQFFRDYDIVMSIDMGVALSDSKIIDPIELYGQAKTALSIADRKGHGFIEYYGKEQERYLLYSTKVESELKQVLRDRKLNVVYQPLVELNTLKTVGVEALIRWYHPTLGHISPVEFLPITERINGMNDLADIVFHQAFDHLRLWKNQNIKLFMSVNIAGQQLVSGKLVTHIMDTIQLYGVSPADIELEVTEEFDLNHIEPIVHQLEELKNLGFRIAIDDFGIGYSSLHYLSQFPVDKIKIDRSFIQNLDEKKVKILQAMFNLAKFMNIQTVVEGIETTEQLEMLKFIGAQYGQGYLFSPPLSADKLESFLSKPQLLNP